MSLQLFPGRSSRSFRVGLAGLLMIFALATMTPQAAAEAPRVVVSVKPIHSLVAGVMAGVGEPRLLVRGAASPHDFALRPSDARALERADIVFWVGPNLETFLERALKALAADARIVSLGGASGLELLAARRGGVWGADGDQGEARDRDPHIWLDPMNARGIAGRAAAALSALDPENAAAYRANRERLAGRIDDLDRDIAALLAPVREVPFIVFHDAYQYLESRYGLAPQGALTALPSRSPGARRMSDLRRRLVDSGAACLFGEPQFETGLARALVRGTSARLAVLDPVGAQVAAGPDAYFAIMRELAGNLADCLGGGS